MELSRIENILTRRAASLPLAFFAGLAGAFAMPPSGLWWILLPALGLLYVLISRASSAPGAVLAAWLFGLGYFLAGLWWVGNALLVEGNDFAWVWPISVIGLPLLLSSFYALAGFVAFKIGRPGGLSSFAAFTAILFLAEWLRGNILSGFPWNLVGYAWSDVPEIAQAASLGGIYFLTWVSIFWFATPGFIFISRRDPRRALIAGALSILSFLALYGYGAVRLEAYVPSYHENINLRIVQPNIPQEEKWDRGRMTENFFHHIKLSYPEDRTEAVTYIIWPETALSHWYTQDKTSMNLVRQMLASYGGPAYLVTGLLRFDPALQRYANSVVMIDAQGNIFNIYDKTHLVPFGEFIPLQKWIPLKPVANFNGFTPGNGQSSHVTPEGFHYGALVCYEVIFPGILPRGDDHPLDLIVNVTNDAWYGDSAGPYQHFSIARFRAIEEGVPLVRAANTGISALIGPAGDVLHKAPLMTTEARVLPLPRGIPTFYRQLPLPNLIVVIFSLIVVGLAIYRRHAVA